MSKWSWFFLLVPILGVAIFLASAELGCALPENISAFGREIDHLYYMILWITGIVFIATQSVLVYILYRYGQSRETRRATYTHGSRKLEILWTIIPSIVLLFIALYQLPAYVKIRFPGSQPNIDPTARVIARQFEWRIIYPGPDGKLDTPDDIHGVNELHIAKNRRVLIDLRSMDVLHSFFLPNVRIKQDAVPGLSIPVWFDTEKSTRQYQAEGSKLARKDFVDLGGLAVQIRAGKTPLAKFLHGKLEPSVRDALAKYDEAVQPSAELGSQLIGELNRLLESERFQDEDRLQGVRLSTPTKEHLGAGDGIYQVLLNRQILEDAFPLTIKRLGRNFELVCAELCGWGHYKMRGRLVIHDTLEEYEAWLQQAAREQEASQ